MRNKEFINTILTHLRNHKSNSEIAQITGKHRNTISTYVNYIRKELIRDPKEIVNLIDSRLTNELNNMTLKELLYYRSQLVPRKAVIQTDTTITAKKEVNYHLKVSASEESLLDALTRKYIKSANTKQSSSLH